MPGENFSRHSFPASAFQTFSFHFLKLPLRLIQPRSSQTCSIGVVKFLRYPFDFTPKVTDLPSIFHLTSIWSSTAASKSEAMKSTLLYNSCSNQKILADLLLKLLKLVKQICEDFFNLSNFYKIKLISQPPTLRLPCSSRLMSNEKCLVDQLLLGQNLLKNI